jgi:phage baseplate assembly protein V
MRTLLQRLTRRVDNLVARAIVWKADNAKLQNVQVSIQKGEVRNAERFQQYGFNSVPLPMAEAVVVFVGGLRDHALCTNVDDRRYRPTDWLEGEVGLYTHEGDFIRLQQGRIVQVVCGTQVDVTAPDVVVHASSKVRIETPMLEVTGEIKDRCDSDGKTMEQMRTAYDAHNHGNVQNGGGITAGPNPTIG